MLFREQQGEKYDFAALHYVITITEIGSFNKASEVLYVAQPSLTGDVRELEKELGIVIFNRTRKGVTLTNDGLEFINHARQLYQQYEIILDKYGKGGALKKKFGISTQHYSFAVKSFVEMVKKFNTAMSLQSAKPKQERLSKTSAPQKVKSEFFI